MSIDIMLPVLPDVRRALDLHGENATQWVIVSYLVGLLGGQIIVGGLADRYGRRPVLLIFLGVFVVGALAASLATEFWFLLAARALQGFGGAAPRILTLAIVRDLFVGRRMARIVSFVTMFFIMVPVVAPAVGQALAGLIHWRAPFFVLAVVGLVALAWTRVRLPETRIQQAGSGGNIWRGLVDGFVTVARTPQAVCYIVANGFMLAALFAYIFSSQQVFGELYGLGAQFPLLFGTVALAMALAGFTNAQIVVAVGMRRVAHTALVGYCAVSFAGLLIAFGGQPPLGLVWGGLLVQFFLHGMIMSNFNALALEPLGAVAGSAASVQGAATTLIGTVGGTIIGQTYNGSVLPMFAGFVVLAGVALATVFVFEGRAGFGRDSDRETT